MTTTQIALREWASAVCALHNGETILILRKGGIAEETKHFELAAREFILLPSFEHQKPELLKEPYRHYVGQSLDEWRNSPELVPIRAYAVAEHEVLITDDDELERLKDFHIWTERLAEERLRWKRSQPLHAILLRVYRLPQTVMLTNSPAYSGCKSWVELEQPIALDGAQPVLSSEEFIVRKESLLQLLR